GIRACRGQRRVRRRSRACKGRLRNHADIRATEAGQTLTSNVVRRATSKNNNWSSPDERPLAPAFGAPFRTGRVAWVRGALSRHPGGDRSARRAALGGG